MSINSITTFDYNGYNIDFDWTSGEYINLTQMAQANGKRVDHWLENKSTQDLIKEWGERYRNSENGNKLPGIPASLEPIVTREGRNGGTWAHRFIAIPFAQWCSPPFALWVSERIDELMRTGTTELVIQDKSGRIQAIPEGFYELPFDRQVLTIQRMASTYKNVSRFAPSAELDARFQSVLLQMLEAIGFDTSTVPQNFADISEALKRVAQSARALPPALQETLTDDQAIIRGMALEHPEKWVYFADLRKVSPFSNRFLYPTRKLETLLNTMIGKGLLDTPHKNLTVVRWIAG